jgi:3-oxosteroid 1-dehydrogenase
MARDRRTTLSSIRENMAGGGRQSRCPTARGSRCNAPGPIIVNAAGRRYMNEALPYVEATHRMYGGTYGQGPGPGENLPSWMIIDQQCRHRYLLAGLQGGQRIPRKWLESSANKPNPSVGEISHPPSYAVEMAPGDLGPKGGMRTDVHARALRDDGTVIDFMPPAMSVHP